MFVYVCWDKATLSSHVQGHTYIKKPPPYGESIDVGLSLCGDQIVPGSIFVACFS